MKSYEIINNEDAEGYYVIVKFDDQTQLAYSPNNKTFKIFHNYRMEDRLTEINIPSISFNMLETTGKENPIGSLKEDREKQWGSDSNQLRGWDRWRNTTFLEVIGAKMDRAIQAYDQIHAIFEESKRTEITEKIEKLAFDGVDSLKDAFNYLRKLMTRIEKDSDLYTK